ncbi:MAG: hypothetical protein AAGA27_05070 [Pseudomonadota bacterium]
MKKINIFLISLLFLFFALQTIKAANDKLHYLLTPADAPSSLAILPKPPAYDSVAFLQDQAAYHAGYALKGMPRWEQAKKDAQWSV